MSLVNLLGKRFLVNAGQRVKRCRLAEIASIPMRSVVLVVASAAGSAAFVPLAGSAPHVVADCASFAAAAASVMRPALLRMPRANTAEMNLGERFVRLVKSNVNELLSNLEDPEKVLEQAVVDMQRDLVKVRQSYAEVSASSKRMTEQAKLAEQEAAKWYSRAQLAVEKGEDELGREALTRRKQQLELADSLKEQIEGQTGALTALYESMKELEAKMVEAKAKKDQIIARARTAKAATKVNDMLAGVGSTSSMAAFERMSEKVEQLEAQASVSKQLAASSSTGKGSTLDDKFKALEASGGVDDELAALKAAQRVLPSAVDNELEEMKKMMDQNKPKESF